MNGFKINLQRTVASLAILSLSLLGIHHTSSAQTRFVSPEGSDSQSGQDPDHPLASIQKAIDEVRSVQAARNDTNTATIYLLEGEYQMTNPLSISARSGSSRASLVIKPYQNKKVIISGGARITGWKKYRDGIWMTKVPQPKNKDWIFNQLFINGNRRFVAKSPNVGFYRVAAFPDNDTAVAYNTRGAKFGYAAGNMNPRWHNLQDVEVVVYHFWTDTHLHVSAIDNQKRIVTFSDTAGKVFTDDFTKQGARYQVTNIFEGLDAPGEWYLDRKSRNLYYMPMPEEDMLHSEVSAPVASALVCLEGNPLKNQYVKNIHFENIHFQCVKADLPAGGTNQAQAASRVSAAIRLKGARNCSFTHCEIRNVGGYAFELLDGCINDSITSNQIIHIGAGGIRVNGGTTSDNPLLRTGRNIIADNMITHYGALYASGVGILLMNTFGNNIVHNDVSWGFYTGISVGWQWGYQQSISWNNKIAFNSIGHIGQGLLSDMGGIYTLGVSPGTVINNNLIHDVESHTYGGWGIYNDEGSTHMLVENNIVYNTKFSGYNIHYAKEIRVRNNIFAFGRFHQLSRSKVEAHKSVLFENNIVYWENGVLLDGHWEDKPYRFHFSPNGKNGDRLVEQTFDMDWNLYFNPRKDLDSVRFNGNSWEKWHQLGKDRHSLYADPLFVDAEKYDFRLRPHSPAFKLGFAPIDTKHIGPRGSPGPFDTDPGSTSP